MNYTCLDMTTYPRKSHFDYFRSLGYPYVGVTVNVDITGFIQKVKESGHPFFLTFCYAVSRAANSVPQFRQRIRGEGIIEFDFCPTSHTVSLENGTYCYCTLQADMPFQDYLPYAIQTQEEAKNSPRVEDDPGEADSLIFISTLPWFSYQTLIQPVPVPADSNPRITWGKYFKEGEGTMIPVTLLCHHALVDGLHLAQFYDALAKELEKLFL